MVSKQWKCEAFKTWDGSWITTPNASYHYFHKMSNKRITKKPLKPLFKQNYNFETLFILNNYKSNFIYKLSVNYADEPQCDTIL